VTTAKLDQDITFPSRDSEAVVLRSQTNPEDTTRDWNATQDHNGPPMRQLWGITWYKAWNVLSITCSHVCIDGTWLHARTMGLSQGFAEETDVHQDAGPTQRHDAACSGAMSYC